MDLSELTRKQALTILTITVLVGSLLVVPPVLRSLYGVPALHSVFGMIIIYFLIDQAVKKYFEVGV